MDLFQHLASGFATALHPEYLLYGLAGALIGTLVGLLPGLGTSVTIAILLPVVYRLNDAIGAFIMFGGIYYGASYAGTTTSILIRTPGETDAVVACLDGYQMARRGRAGAALTTSAFGSFIAGTLATIGLMTVASPLVSVALQFGPAEIFALMILALSVVSSLGGRPSKSAFSCLLGLALGTVGVDFQTAQPRFTFGHPQLDDGISFIIAAVGLFAVSEALVECGTLRRRQSVPAMKVGKLRMNRDEARRSVLPWLRGTVLGFFLGILPGTGNSIPTFVSYSVEKAVAKPAVPFGTGAIEGLAGPDAAKNAASGGHLIPLLFLGIPGSATTAVMLEGLRGLNLPTGPLLLQQHAALVWAVIASLYIGNVMLLVLNLPLIPLWARVIHIPKQLLVALIFGVSAVGVYSLNGSSLDLITMFLFGIVGLVFRRLNIPRHRCSLA